MECFSLRPTGTKFFPDNSKHIKRRQILLMKYTNSYHGTRDSKYQWNNNASVIKEFHIYLLKTLINLSKKTKHKRRGTYFFVEMVWVEGGHIGILYTWFFSCKTPVFVIADFTDLNKIVDQNSFQTKTIYWQFLFNPFLDMKLFLIEKCLLWKL